MLKTLVVLGCIYMLAAKENGASIDSREMKEKTLQDLSSNSVGKMIHFIERQRRVNWRSAALGAILVGIAAQHMDVVTLAVLSAVIIASLQNFRAYHIEDELTTVLNEFFQVSKSEVSKESIESSRGNLVLISLPVAVLASVLCKHQIHGVNVLGTALITAVCLALFFSYRVMLECCPSRFCTLLSPPSEPTLPSSTKE